MRFEVLNNKSITASVTIALLFCTNKQLKSGIVQINVTKMCKQSF